MITRFTKLLATLFAFALIAAACGSDSDGSATAGADDSTESGDSTVTGADDDAADDGAGADDAADQPMMEMPPFAADMKIDLSSDAAGGVLTENELDITVEPVGYEFRCDLAGKPVEEGTGHYHVLLDQSLVNMVCDANYSISMQNVAPGEHTVAVVPALNNHGEVMDNMAAFTFDYQPSDPLPDVVDVEDPGTPTITIVSPAPGETVSGDFEIVVEVENLNLSCDLFGRPGLFGYGHLHVHLDGMDGPMNGMGSIQGMGCSTTFPASTAGLESGSTHTFLAVLADNGHAPFPGAIDEVEVEIG